jgi:type II secretory pathway component PulL
MAKFIPYVKLSKKKQRELAQQQRRTWGSLVPVTRRSQNPKAYDRQKARQFDLEQPGFLILFNVRFSFCSYNLHLCLL